jgi:hypothetical protein
VILKGGAHNNLEADAIPLKAARHGATPFKPWKVNEGVDAEAWALNDDVDLGAGLETCECQEARLGRQIETGSTANHMDAPSFSETIPTGWTPIVTSSISISMPPRTNFRSKNTLAATCTRAASPKVRSRTRYARWQLRTHRERCFGRQDHLNLAVFEACPPAKRHAEASSEADGATNADRWRRPNGEGELNIEQLLLNRREERLTARDSEVRSPYLYTFAWFKHAPLTPPSRLPMQLSSLVTPRSPGSVVASS